MSTATLTRRGVGGLLSGLLAVSIAACGSSERSATTAWVAASSVTRAAGSVTTTAPPTPRRVQRRAKQAITVRVSSTAYGAALVDRRGFALYLFTRDRTRASTCDGACATAWPPYIVRTTPKTAAKGADSRLLGSVRRLDGRLQVTYAGHPLYYYVGDRRPNQVLCQAVAEYGGSWYVVAPNGHAIH